MKKVKKIDIFAEFNKEIKSHNKDIETYRELTPKVMPIIEMYQKELERTALGLNKCVFYFPYDKVPTRFYHELDDHDLVGEPICYNSTGWTSFGGPLYSEVLVTLK